MEIKLPYSSEYAVCIDHRGIILEGLVDPLIGINLLDAIIIFFMSDSQIEKYFGDRLL
jgi:hypothetical protein